MAACNAIICLSKLGKPLSPDQAVSQPAAELRVTLLGAQVVDRSSRQLERERIGRVMLLTLKGLYEGPVGRFGTGSGLLGPLLTRLSERKGRYMDSPESIKEIRPFLKAFPEIDMGEAAEPLAAYKSFNEFFMRRLKRGARPVVAPNNPYVLTSAADCRLMVFDSVSDATRIWIKGTQFSTSGLLGCTQGHTAAPTCSQSVAPAGLALAAEPAGAETADGSQEGSRNTSASSADGTRIAAGFEGGSLAVLRLAPQDYHRYHAPTAGKVLSITHVPGELYTVNPIAIRSPYTNPLTRNRRSVLLLDSTEGWGCIAVVAVGATLVGSIRWSVQPGQQVAKGDELGCFGYGGSTLVLLFQRGVAVRWDEDLLDNSARALETKVKAGERLGQLEPAKSVSCSTQGGSTLAAASTAA